MFRWIIVRSTLVRYLLPCLIYLMGCMTGEAQQRVTPQNALQSYLNNGDTSYSWVVKDSTTLGNVKAYTLLLTSQKWRQYTWRHQLTLLVPKDVKYTGTLLYIDGGSNSNQQPAWSRSDRMVSPMANIATTNKAVVAVLYQTPNQPLFNNLYEDALISYTLHQYQKDGDYTWPLLFPMVKSAVRAMDAVQEFCKQRLRQEVNGFVISGASKRGWTTWLTGATGDRRVRAIAPMVIDVLNMPVNLEYQKQMYGTYSEQISDYVRLGIPQSANTPKGKAIVAMIDPYSYRSQLTMPKLIVMGTNDEYWTIDAIKHYYNDLPGSNLIHYVPNAGHSLGGGRQAFQALSAFVGTTLQNRKYPTPTWNIESGPSAAVLTMEVQMQDLVEVVLWSATSADRDFRNDKWTSKSMGKSTIARIQVEQPYPANGFRAFYVDLKYKAPGGGEYTVSTRAFVLSQNKVL
ncbi:PhoPQ-activated pathogenicity-related family protein [Telluribacter sp. SYSU D00476]|uniref:PhoPQ-activated pathogenicity-related family protein n=1 Tax=Telluribacter sp. SYSU D00476 TaxID=2811430 RepID=UPI001FF5D9C0|nr:PhoPQ-activated protein PqaA family protein [Telluribacter sp. SYSU D00476]